MSATHGPKTRPPIEHGNPLYELTRARIVEALRDRNALFWSFGFPVFLVITLGVAFGGGPKSHNRIGFVCSAPTDPSACRAVEAQLKRDPELDVRPLDLAVAKHQLGLGQLDVVVQAAREEAEPRPAVKRRVAEAPAAKPARPSGSKPDVLAASEPLNIIPAAASESEPPEKPLGPIDRVVARAEALKDKAMSKLAAIPLWIATTGGKLIGVETNSSSAPATRLMSASW